MAIGFIIYRESINGEAILTWKLLKLLRGDIAMV